MPAGSDLSAFWAALQGYTRPAQGLSEGAVQVQSAWAQSTWALLQVDMGSALSQQLLQAHLRVTPAMRDDLACLLFSLAPQLIMRMRTALQEGLSAGSAHGKFQALPELP